MHTRLKYAFSAHILKFVQICYTSFICYTSNSPTTPAPGHTSNQSANTIILQRPCSMCTLHRVVRVTGKYFFLYTSLHVVYRFSSPLFCFKLNFTCKNLILKFLTSHAIHPNLTNLNLIEVYLGDLF